MQILLSKTHQIEQQCAIKRFNDIWKKKLKCHKNVSILKYCEGDKKKLQNLNEDELSCDILDKVFFPKCSE